MIKNSIKIVKTNVINKITKTKKQVETKNFCLLQSTRFVPAKYGFFFHQKKIIFINLFLKMIKIIDDFYDNSNL